MGLKSFFEVNKMNGQAGLRPDEHPLSEFNNDVDLETKAPSQSGTGLKNPQGDSDTGRSK